MKREHLRKVKVYDPYAKVEFTGYFHEYYKEFVPEHCSALYAIIEKEDGSLYLATLAQIKFIS